MRAIRLSVIILLSIVLAPVINAQTDAQFTQYFALPAYYNPSAAGIDGMLNIHAASRLQWVGIKNGPKTFTALADMPLKIAGLHRAGAGIAVTQENIGLFKNLQASLQASWQLKAMNGTLAIGLEAGFINSTFSGSEVILPDGDESGSDSDEGIPSTDLTGKSFDIGIGVTYFRPRFRAGLSLKHANSPTVSYTSGGSDGNTGKTYEFQAGRTLYFMAEGNIPVENTLFEVIASMLAKTDFTFSTAEATARLRYRKFLSIGAGYRYNDAVSLLIGAEIKNFFIGYSYDNPIGTMSGAGSGSHEITAGYRMKIDLSEKNKYKQKSIRIM